MVPFRLYLQQHSFFFSGTIKENTDLSQITYYRIGGPAHQVIAPSSLQDLTLLSQYLCQHPHPFFILGRGSNILANDQGFNGTIIKTHNLPSLWEHRSDTLSLSAGMMNAHVLSECIQQGLTGLEFLTGIPGTIGGAVFMNAGNALFTSQDQIISVSFFDFFTQQIIHQPLDKHFFSYRKNHFLKPHQLILYTTWKVASQPPDAIKTRIQDLLKKRNATQPINFPSCGSVFKNPPTIKAWQILDTLGLRGLREKNAQFSEKHPNFIINLGKARAEDVHTLIQIAKKKAFHELNIMLEEEVLYL